MNLNLLKQSIRDYWKSSLIFVISLVLYVWLLVAIMPTMLKTSNSGIEQILKSYPKEVLTLLTGGTDIMSMLTPEGFLSVEFLSLWWIIIMAGFAITFATSIAAKEMDEGTIEFLLSQPISRVYVILTRFVALAFYLLVLIGVSLGSMVILTRAYDVKLKSAHLVGVGLLCFAFLLAISAYTLLFSVVFKGRGKAVVWSVAVLFISHLVNALATFNETVEKFRFLSPFRYYNPYKILKTGNILWRDLAVFAAVLLICLVLSLIVFQKKDITVT